MSENNSTEKLQFIEDQIRLINERNAKVEIDKAWEISNSRIISICLLTWVIMSSVFWIIGVTNFFINAIIPTLGFYLSNRSLPILKKWWIKRNFN
jgi:hypothetical protein